MATNLAMNKPPVVSQQEWEAAHQQLLGRDCRTKGTAYVLDGFSSHSVQTAASGQRPKN
jgi:hypothetical protein